MAEAKTEPLLQIKTLVTETPTGPDDGTVVHTPSGKANIEIVTMTWYSQVGVRALRTFMQNFIWHLLAAGIGVGVAEAVMTTVEAATGVQVPTKTRVTIDVLSAAFFDSLGPTLMSVLHNAAELLAGLDTKGPSYRA